MTVTQSLTVFDMGIDTHQEPVVYMRSDSHICIAEGFMPSSRVLLQCSAGREIIATLNVVSLHVLPAFYVGFSRIAMARLQVEHGAKITIKHAPLITSTSALRKKIYGNELSGDDINAIVRDIAAYRYRDIEIASFLCSCAGNNLTVREIIYLTKAMVNCGERLRWPGHEYIYDKHCIGGLPGNRTTPLVVAIASAAGLVIPKSSSRAITSPAGTADTMEILMQVALTQAQIQSVVADTGACLIWGGTIGLSPIDDIFIRLESALNLDGTGQLIASVLSKKIAAGATHVLIDIPCGDTAKVRTRADAERLSRLFTQVGTELGLRMRCIITDGEHPIGFGIGPAEEARDILSVLQCDDLAPQDLRHRSLLLAAELLDFSDGQGREKALIKATHILDSGLAWQQFQSIRMAQGIHTELPHAQYQQTQCAQHDGFIRKIDNRRLARLAKLAGAPLAVGAGLRLHVTINDKVSTGMALVTLCSDSQGALDYALDYFQYNADMFVIGE